MRGWNIASVRPPQPGLHPVSKDCQARWAQFFSQFNFTLSYQPGSQNTCADALSRLHLAPYRGNDTQEGIPDTILPLTRAVGGINWNIESLIRTA